MMAILSILTAVLTIIGAVIMIARPFWAFIGVALMFPCEQLLQAYFPFLQVHSSYFNIFIGLLAIVAVGLRIMKGDPVFEGLGNLVTVLTYIQFTLYLVGKLYSPGVAPYEVQLAQTGHYLILNLMIMPLLVVSLEEFRKILVGMMIVGALLAVLILLNPNTQYWAGRLTLDLGMMSRKDDTMGNPLATATLGGTVALIAMLMVPKSGSQLFALLRVTAFVLGLGLAIGSGSRGQVMATVVAAIAFFPVARRLDSAKNFIVSALVLMIIGAGVYATFHLFIGEQNQKRWDPALMLQDVTMRFDMCTLFIGAWLSSPTHWLFGLGTSAWMVVGADQFNSDYVHNTAVEILCEQGLVGATVFVIITYLVIRAGFRMWWQYRNDPALRASAALLLAICAFELFNALKQGNIASGAPFYWWLVLVKVSTAEERRAVASVEFTSEDELIDHALATNYGEYDMARA